MNNGDQSHQPPADAPRPSLSPGLHHLLDEVGATLEKIAMYPSDFDGHGAQAPSPDAIRHARLFVEAALHQVGEMGESDLTPYSIAPLPNRHIFLEWEGAGGSLEIEVRPDDTYGYLLAWHEGGSDASARASMPRGMRLSPCCADCSGASLSKE